jgi:hypothetical protein
MPEIFEATTGDIGELKAVPLVKLLECLLENELAANGIPISAAYVSLDVNIRDGGEDGLVVWEGGVPRTNFLQGRRTLLQSKSGKLDPHEFTDELFADGSKPSVSMMGKAS